MPKHYRENPQSVRTVAVKVSRTGQPTSKPPSFGAWSPNCGNCGGLYDARRAHGPGEEEARDKGGVMDLDERDERAAIVRSHFSEREFGALELFYAEGQDPASICSEMRLTMDQFVTVRRSYRAHLRRLRNPTEVRAIAS